MINFKTMPSSIVINPEERVCGNCDGWVGSWFFKNSRFEKRQCLKPLAEGQTFVNFSGITKHSDTCSRHKFNEFYKESQRGPQK